MVEPLASDVAVTLLGAAGCALYARFLWGRRSGGIAAMAPLFLSGLMAFVLMLRGFFWLTGSPLLGRVVFAGAVLLPLAITLFTEALLRRHHPLALKLFVAAVTVVFTLANLFFDLASNVPLLLAFCTCLGGTVLANGALLLAADKGELASNEVKLARAVVVAAVLAVPLATTDFREELRHSPVRVGALGALLFVYVHLSLSDGRSVIGPLIARILATLGAALVLAAAFALATHGLSATLTEATLRGLPLAWAWTLLTAIFLRVRAASLENAEAIFLRWLAHARLDSASGFLHSLTRLSQTEDHLVLEGGALQGYAMERIFAAAGREPVSLADARNWAGGSGDKVEAGEQLRDLLERHGMTHALLVSQAPGLVVLLNLPGGVQASIGELRARVIQRLARRFSRED